MPKKKAPPSPQAQRRAAALLAALERGEPLEDVLDRYGLRDVSTGLRFHVGAIRMAQRSVRDHLGVAKAMNLHIGVHVTEIQRLLDGHPGRDPDEEPIPNPLALQQKAEREQEQQAEAAAVEESEAVAIAAAGRLAHLADPRRSRAGAQAGGGGLPGGAL